MSRPCHSLPILGCLLALTACAAEPARNIVFVSFDTTRRDHLSVYGYSRPTTPTLEQLAGRGALFENATAQQIRTLPSHASMFTGLYPHGHQSFSNKHVLPDSQTTLAEILLDAGFRTAAFVSGYTLTSNWGLTQGFEAYGDDFEGMSRWGESTAAAAGTWLGGLDADERFFLFVHFYDAHGPYQTPDNELAFRSSEPGPRLADIPEYQQLAEPDGRPLRRLNAYVDRYDTLIRYQDELLANLLDEIDLETTVLVVTADHGETLGGRAQVLDHGSNLFDEEVRIPLIIVGPGVVPGKYDRSVATIDLLPTILELLGVASPATAAWHGASLAALLAGGDAEEPAERVIFSSSVVDEPANYADRGYELDARRQIHAARQGRWKLIVYPHAAQDYVELYDLQEDPKERRNVAGEHPQVRLRLLMALAASQPDYREPTPTANISEEERERLRALGYIR